MRILALSIAVLLLGGCGIYRGLPSHGGGKRFDEEQRAVSASVRTAIGALRLDELEGLTVKVVIENVAHSGGGDYSWPGPELLNLNASSSSGNSASDVWRVYGPAPPESQWDPERTGDNSSHNAGGNLTWRLTPRYTPLAFNTDPDLNYLRASLHMRLLHEGLLVVSDNADATLTVLVDVLGTNLSRIDALLWLRDNLAASCELTYYATRNPTQALLFPARREGAEARYSETGVILCTGLSRSRSVDALDAQRMAGIPTYDPHLTPTHTTDELVMPERP
jgi:hypothetical protein